jgi:hypothetical protein
MDVGSAVAGRLVDLPTHLLGMRACLAMTEIPEVEPGSQCKTPYVCEFHERCMVNKPDDWISYLPHLNQPERWHSRCSVSKRSPRYRQISGSRGTRLIRDATASGQAYVSPDFARLLGGYGPPVCYISLDFEAMMPTIPLYEGTWPYQTIPFQWSLHAATEDGVLRHREFLADGDSDPRRRFAETMIEALDAFEGPIIVYSPYEKTQPNELARKFPDLAALLNAIVIRLADLLPIVRGAVYLPDSGSAIR